MLGSKKYNIIGSPENGLAKIGENEIYIEGGVFTKSGTFLRPDENGNLIEIEYTYDNVSTYRTAAHFLEDWIFVHRKINRIIFKEYNIIADLGNNTKFASFSPRKNVRKTIAVYNSNNFWANSGI